jgi:hypothetical protein
MTLHEAIAEVLKLKGASNSTKIATIINERKLYTRKDGQPIRASQVIARAKQHADLFAGDTGGTIQLKSVLETGSEDYARFFLQGAKILAPRFPISSFSEAINFLLWLAEEKCLQNILTRLGDKENPKVQTKLEQLSVAFGLTDINEVRRAFKSLLNTEFVKGRMSSNTLTFLENALHSIQPELLYEVLRLISTFSFDITKADNIIEGARKLISGSKIALQSMEYTPSDYLLQLVAKLSQIGKRDNLLNLFTSYTPLAPNFPASSKGKLYLHCQSSSSAVFFELCKMLSKRIETVLLDDISTLMSPNWESFDRIYTILPVGNKPSKLLQAELNNNSLYGDKGELYEIEAITRLLSSKGMAFIVVPRSLLSSAQGASILRSKLLDEDLIDLVVSLDIIIKVTQVLSSKVTHPS